MNHRPAMLSTVCVVALLAAGAVGAWAAPGRALADWTPLTTTSIDTAGTDPAAVAATDAGGVAYVAWQEAPSNAGLPHPTYVDAIVNGAPVAVGGALGASDSCFDPSMTAIGATPYVACTDNASAIHVYDWTGAAWAPVGGAIATAYLDTPVSITDDNGQPAVAYLGTSGGNPDAGGTVKLLNGGSWVTVGTAGALHSSDPHTFVHAPLIAMNGTTPVVAWQEDNGPGINDTEAAYAAQLSGGSWSLTNGGAPISQAATADALDDLRTIGGTTYAATETEDFYDADVNVLALSGSSFAQVGASVLTDEEMADLPALGSAAGVPIVAEGYSDNSPGFVLVSQELTADGWSAFGSPLGIPPVAPTGDGYGDIALTTDGAGNPYAVFTEEAPNPSGQPQSQVTNVYVEEYTPGGVNPNAPTGPTAVQYPPQVSGSAPAPITATGGSVPMAAVLSRTGSATLARRGRRLSVRTGLHASCPAGTARCTAKVTVRMMLHGRRPVVVRRTERIAAGTERTLSVTLSGVVARRLDGRVTGSARVVLSGPNRQSVMLTQRLRGRPR